MRGENEVVRRESFGRLSLVKFIGRPGSYISFAGMISRLLSLQKSQMEVIARNEYMFGDERDPTSCSLFYFALNKVRLVHGLWKSAAWHKEQPLMLKFLSNDFNEARWRTAAMKNAFALLGKQRFGEQ